MYLPSFHTVYSHLNLALKAQQNFLIADSQHFPRYFENAKENLLQPSPSFRLAR
jgi:hypothetical protein